MNICNVPSKDELEDSFFSNPLQCYAINSLTNNLIQSEESFEEQKLAMTTFINDIDSYRGLSFQYSYTKKIGIHGFTGAVKIWCIKCCIIYANSKRIKLTTTDMVCIHALQLGRIHVHQLFKLPTEDNLTPHRQAELSVLKLMKNLKKIIFKGLLMC